MQRECKTCLLLRYGMMRYEKIGMIYKLFECMVCIVGVAADDDMFAIYRNAKRECGNDTVMGRDEFKSKVRVLLLGIFVDVDACYFKRVALWSEDILHIAVGSFGSKEDVQKLACRGERGIARRSEYIERAASV